MKTIKTCPVRKSPSKKSNRVWAGFCYCPDFLAGFLFKSGATVLVKSRRGKQKSKGKYHLTENSCGSYARSVRFPVAVNEDKIEALCKNGVLKIILPKSKKTKSKEINLMPGNAQTTRNK